MKFKQQDSDIKLTNRTKIKVRFSEVDAMQIVWHGEYVRYFEDGREAFGKEYALDYLSVYNQGYMLPIVDLNCKFKRPLSLGDEMIVETAFIPCEAAKIKFEYTIFSAKNNEVIATGSSIQVFLDLKRDLQLMNPPFYLEWKKKWKII